MAKETKNEHEQFIFQRDRLKSDLLALEETIHDFMDSLKGFRAPLTDSREALPEATQQLDRITEQTEQATNKVLDVVESIASSQNDLIVILNDVLNLVTDGAADPEVVKEKIEKAEEIANRTQNDTMIIMDALQFQDITAQQMNHAASLLEEVESKIGGILGGMGEEEEQSLKKNVAKRRERAFDPHADMERKHTEQTGVDDIINATKAKKR